MNNKTLLDIYNALAVTSLKQQALVKVGETLINRDQEEFVGICLASCPIIFSAVETWHDRWMYFKTNLSSYVEQLSLPKSLKSDMRDTLMCLYHNARDFEKYTTFESAVTRRFTSRCDVNIRRTFEEHVGRTISDVPYEQKFNYLKDACYLCQDQYVQSILCELLKEEKSALESSLRNAGRLVEVVNWLDLDIRFVLEDIDDPASWISFVTMLNNKSLSPIRFSFEHNVLKVSTKWYCPYLQLKLLWSRMTTDKKRENAPFALACAMGAGDVLLLVKILWCLDSAERLKLVKANLVSFVLCFLKHPYGRHCLPDLQIVEEESLMVAEEEHRVLYELIFDIALGGDFCSNLTDCLIQFWQYITSKDKVLAKRVLFKIKMYFRRINLSCFHDELCPSVRAIFSKFLSLTIV